MASNQYLYKPSSESDGNLVVLTPNAFNNRINQVEIVDGDGNVISRGRFSGNQHNGGRGHFRFDDRGEAFAGATVRISFDDGTESVSVPVGSGGRTEQNFNSAGQTSGSATTTGATTTGPGGTRLGTSESGQFVLPSFADYSTLQAPNVSYEDNIARARAAGAEARDTLFRNTSSPEAKETALGLVDTDIAGINRGLDEFIPRIRQEGDVDQGVNIRRAGEIDDANLDRIPKFNSFNRGEVATNNTFNQEQRDNAVDASGLDYRNRVGSLVERLDARSRTGRLGGELDESLSTELANRGSDLGAASGISSISGAGVRANDRLTVSERVNLALGAEASLPGVLAQGQAVLSSPEERAPTIFGQPQAIPLNTSDVANKIPITSNISAGAAQQTLGTQATTLEAIPATTALSTGTSIDKYNSESEFNRDLTVLNAEQSQLNATDNAVQGSLNADTAAELRQEQAQAFSEGRQVNETADLADSIGSGISAIPGIVDAFTNDNEPSFEESPEIPGLGGGQPLENGQIPEVDTGTTDIPLPPSGAKVLGSSSTAAVSPAVAVPTAPSGTTGKVFRSGLSKPINIAIPYNENNVGRVVDQALTSFEETFGNDQPLDFGRSQVSVEDFRGLVTDIKEFHNGAPLLAASEKPTRATEGSDSDTPASSSFSGGGNTKGAGIIDSFTQPFEDSGVDFEILGQTTDTVNNWDTLTSAEQFESATQISVDVLENRGIISSEAAANIQVSNDALGTLMDPTSSNSERLQAVAIAGTTLATDGFTGTLQNPTSIGGDPVTGQPINVDGERAYEVTNSAGESSVVTQSSLSNAANTTSALQAFSIVTSGADNEDKLAALAGVGIRHAHANEILTNVEAGNAGAALAVFNLAANFQDMNAIQRGIAVAQTGAAVFGAAANATAPATAGALSTSLNSFTAPAAQEVAAQTVAQTGAEATAQTATQSTAATAGSIVGGAASVYGIVAGIDQASDVISSIDDMPQSQAVSSGAVGLGTAGASIGAGVAGIGATIGAFAAAGNLIPVPVVGAAIGAAVGIAVGVIAGSTGTGKNTAQTLRDGWREGMEKAGFAERNAQGSHEVTLADGSKYDIGKDGGHKIANTGDNVDGKKERHTFDVDWSNPVAVESIPEAHLFAIATGLDPTSNEGHGFFQKAVSQSLNAATSNATSVQGVRDNFRSMLGNQVDPRQLAMRVETLRVSNSITDQEYGVYLDRINQVFGSQITPSDRTKASEFLVAKLSENPVEKLDPAARKLYDTLTNQDKLEKTRTALQRRLNKEQSRKA